ncbi:MAG: hypothetical protein Alpg2KO_27150 [Alphaproteobacteria bacterium]
MPNPSAPSAATAHQAGTRDPAKRPLGRLFARILSSSADEHEMALRAGSVVGAVGGLAWTLNLYSGVSIGVKTLTFMAGLGTVAGAALGVALPGIAVACVMMHQEKLQRAKYLEEQAKERARVNALHADLRCKARQAVKDKQAEQERQAAAAAKSKNAAKPNTAAPDASAKPCAHPDCPSRP